MHCITALKYMKQILIELKGEIQKFILQKSRAPHGLKWLLKLQPSPLSFGKEAQKEQKDVSSNKVSAFFSALPRIFSPKLLLISHWTPLVAWRLGNIVLASWRIPECCRLGGKGGWVVEWQLDVISTYEREESLMFKHGASRVRLLSLTSRLFYHLQVEWSTAWYISKFSHLKILSIYLSIYHLSISQRIALRIK